MYLHTPSGTFVIEKMKAHNSILHQQSEHVAVRTAQENCQLLREAGFSVERVRVLAHYKPMLRGAHAFTVLPGVGRYSGARLLIEAHK